MCEGRHALLCDWRSIHKSPQSRAGRPLPLMDVWCCVTYPRQSMLKSKVARMCTSRAALRPTSSSRGCWQYRHNLVLGSSSLPPAKPPCPSRVRRYRFCQKSNARSMEFKERPPSQASSHTGPSLRNFRRCLYGWPHTSVCHDRRASTICSVTDSPIEISSNLGRLKRSPRRLMNYSQQRLQPQRSLAPKLEKRWNGLHAGMCRELGLASTTSARLGRYLTWYLHF